MPRLYEVFFVDLTTWDVEHRRALVAEGREDAILLAMAAANLKLDLPDYEAVVHDLGAVKLVADPGKSPLRVASLEGLK